MEEKKQNDKPLNKDFKVPKLRFKEFKKSWSISKLGNLVKIKRGGSPRPIEKYISKNNDGINRIKISDADESGYINKTEEKIILEGVKNTRLVHKGDLLLSNSMSFGRPYILNIDGAIHDGWLLISEFINEFNKEFLRAYLESNICKSQYQKAAAGGVVSNLNKEIVKSIYVSYPSIIEQNKIARFLSLTDYKLEVLEAKIATLKKYKEGIMKLCLSLSQNEGKTLKRLVSENELRIGRGTIIPRQEGIYPVYSSSAKNDGLFCYTNFYKYDEDLITWSIDGGGQPFYRKKHKFSITNVCGFIKIIDFAKWDYTWLYINIWNNWCRNKFDYTSKAHPSIIEEIYKIKPLSLDKQKKISMVFLAIEKHEKNLESKLNKLKEIKKYLLSNLFI